MKEKQLVLLRSLGLWKVSNILENKGFIPCYFMNDSTMYPCKIAKGTRKRTAVIERRKLLFFLSDMSCWNGGWRPERIEEDIFEKFKYAYAFADLEDFPFSWLYISLSDFTLFDMVPPKTTLL